MRTEYEVEANSHGFHYVVGCDEAGRGPMAGPLVVGACMFKEGYENDLINDSKKLSESKREALFDMIIQDAIAYNIQIIDVKEVDALNVYEASRQGMLRCIESLAIKPDFVLTDAMPLPNDIPHLSIIKGDSKSVSIAAASILAKVTRDRIMNEYDTIFPEYNFKKHKGYPTKEHKELLKQYGPCKIHRRSFKPVQDVLNVQLSIFDEL